MKFTPEPSDVESTLDMDVVPFGDIGEDGDYTDLMVGDIIAPQHPFGTGGLKDFFGKIFGKKTPAVAAKAASNRAATVASGKLPGDSMFKFVEAVGIKIENLLFEDSKYMVALREAIAEEILIADPYPTFIRTGVPVGGAATVTVEQTDLIAGAAVAVPFLALIISVGGPGLNTVPKSSFTIEVSYITEGGVALTTGLMTFSFDNANVPGIVYFSPFALVKGTPKPIKGYAGTTLGGDALVVDFVGLPDDARVSVRVPGAEDSFVLNMLKALNM